MQISITPLKEKPEYVSVIAKIYKEEWGWHFSEEWGVHTQEQMEADLRDNYLCCTFGRLVCRNSRLASIRHQIARSFITLDNMSLCAAPAAKTWYR